MPKDFERVAIINRGEPAMRLIRAVREWNAARGPYLRTIALVTERDRDALFAREADVVFDLGPATFLDQSDLDEQGLPRRKSSYVDLPRLRAALQRTRADAAWVGWGFVSEQAAFAELCEELGVVFIGPPPAAMRALGDKIGAKRLAAGAGVPVAPWSEGPIGSLDEARAHAARIGYPLLVKATAGGGGRGIRFVHSEDQLEDALATATSEARKAFGDGTVFLEARIDAARHVEVQVLADAHGTVWAVGVRDCTAQRANQKVIEEAPSPVLSPAQDVALCEASAALARAAGYVNAGTVEFLFEPATGRACFMEMNTRLQVEHPVTELLTGLDLVRWQLAVARGEALPATPPPSRGHAIEVRLCAEDPDAGFAPAPGRVVCFRPALGPGIRTDAGVREGDRVPVEFDSMIAKVIAHGSTREEARARLVRALLEGLFVVEGGTTNRAFLLRLIEHPDFIEARFDTRWIDRLMRQARPGEPEAWLALVATAIERHEHQLHEEELNFFASAAHGRPSMPPQRRHPIELRFEGVDYELQVATLEPGRFQVRVDDVQLDVRLEHDGPYEARLFYDTPNGVGRHRIVSVPAGLDHRVEVDSTAYRISRDPSGLLRAPAPGLVFAVYVAEGTEVREGDRLLGLEAMKMEMAVTAPYNGRVRRVLVGQGVQVSAGEPMLVIEPAIEKEDPRTAGARVSFPRDVGSVPPGPAQRFRATLDELRRLMLGFHVDDARVGALLSSLEESFPREPHDDDGTAETVRVQAPYLDVVWELLSLFLEVETLFSKDYSEGSATRPRLSYEQCLHLFLREFRAEGRGLPEEFLRALRTALARYGVASLAESPRLRDGFVWLHRSHLNVAAKGRVVVAILQRCLERPAWRREISVPALRALLDRLMALTQGPHPGICEAVHQARYALFEGEALQARRREATSRTQAALARLHGDPGTSDRPALMAEMLAMPFTLMDLFGPMLAGGDASMRALLLEVLARRFYVAHSLSEPCTLEVDGRPYVLLRYGRHEQQTLVLAAHAQDGELDPVLDGLVRIARQVAPGTRVLADVCIGLGGPLDEDKGAALLAASLDRLNGDLRVERVGAVLFSPVGAPQFHTFSRSEARWTEEETVRGFHPTAGEQLELWRMRNFHVRRLATTSPDLYLFHARSRQNARDERYLAVAEVRELHPARSPSGKLVSLPELEHAVLQTFYAIREQQARREARRRLAWNRITVFVRPPLLARREELRAIGARLHAASLGVGLEKLSIRVFLHEDPAQIPRDTVVSLADRTGHRLDLTLSEPNDEPLRVLDDYNLKVIRALQRRLTYAYEIIKMLAPAEPTAGVPAGTFEEYDLETNGQGPSLVPVNGRPFGENTANVVVGAIKNQTAKHPEGMTRVIILGDGTREMGALAEPECRRIIAALDLAEQRGVPVEWFPISSGAKIAMDSGTENLDWTAAVLRRIVQFTQTGGEINVVVDGINVGAQSYWNAEATMLMHTRGCLIMTPRGAMLLTGKRALDYSGGISAEDNLGIGGFERIMGPNGQAQYHAHDLDEACRTLIRYYEHTYVAPGERHPRRRPTADPASRDISQTPYVGENFTTLGDLWKDEKNPGRKRPFDVRSLLRAVADQDATPLERWASQVDGEVAVVWETHLGGIPLCLIGVESKPVPRLGYVPSDGPETWSGGTLFPLGSKKVARAINSASGNRPVVLLANLSGFDGSPESLRRLQLEYGAEIGRAVVNFRGPMVFCVVARYHGGAYVVFSKRLNPGLSVLALEGSYASVIGGAPAAAVVFPEEARALTLKDPRVVETEARLRARGLARPQLAAEYADLYARVHAEKLRELAERFDKIHSVQRAQAVGSLDGVLAPSALRPALVAALEAALGAPAAAQPSVGEAASSPR